MSTNSRNLKILLTNIHSFLNSGDAALITATIINLQQAFPGCTITLMMNDPGSYGGHQTVLESFLTWVQKSDGRPRLRFLRLVAICLLATLTYHIFHRPLYLAAPREIRSALEAYFDSDFVASVPGGNLYSYGRGTTLMVQLFTLLVAIWAGKPLYLLPQSYGPFKYRREKMLVRWIFDRARLVMAREAMSVKHLTACGLKPAQCIVLPDPAFAFQGFPKEAGLAWLQERGVSRNPANPLLGISAFNWGRLFQESQQQELYEQALVVAIRVFINQCQGQVILLPNSCGPTSSEDDRITLHNIAQRIPDLHQELFVVDQHLGPEMLQSIYSNLDIMIGTRMHANILALTRGTPVIPIGYLHKTLGVARYVGIEDWVLDIQNINGEVLAHKLLEMFVKRAQMRDHIQHVLPSIIDQAKQPAKLIADDLNCYYG